MADSHLRVSPLQLGQSKYFRISITNTCNFRCYFCHNEGQQFERFPLSDLLTAEDFIWVSTIAHRAGFRKFKITGGEPTLNPRLLDIVRGIAQIGVEDLSMISNGTNLTHLAENLKMAGLMRLNISLYSMDRESFERDQQVGGRLLEIAISGVDAALNAGFTDLKLNYVFHGMHRLKEFYQVCSFARKRHITVVLLPILPVSLRTGDEQIALTTLYETIQAQGIATEELLIDSEGMEKRLITLSDNTKVLLRKDELAARQPFPACVTCPNRIDCREGVFPTRISCDGKLIRCLAKGMRPIDIREMIQFRESDQLMGLLSGAETQVIATQD